MEHRDALLEAFEQTDPRVVPRQNAFRVLKLHEEADNFRKQPIGSLRQRLHDKVLAIPIYDERRDEIPFPMDEAVRGGVDGEPLAKGKRLFEA